MKGELFCTTDPYSEKLRKACFTIIFEDKDEMDCENWKRILIELYSEEVIAMFGEDPFEVSSYLTDWWETEDYEDPRTGICLRYYEWAIYFSNEYSHFVYSELIDAKRQLDQIKSVLR